MKIDNAPGIAELFDEVIDTSHKEIDMAIRNQSFNRVNKLAYTTAELCGVPVSDILSHSGDTEVICARNMFWFSLRYICGLSYQTIATKITNDRCTFTSDAIRKSVERMSVLISSSRLWKCRWESLKQLVGCAEQKNANEPKSYTMEITVPKELKDSLKINIK